MSTNPGAIIDHETRPTTGVTIRQAAALYRRPYSTMRAWVQRARLAPVGGRIAFVYALADLDALVQAKGPRRRTRGSP